MPALTIGTAGPVVAPEPVKTLAEVLRLAVDAGYTSFDIADRYARMDFLGIGQHNSRPEFYDTVREALRRVGKEKAWLTVKGARREVDEIIDLLHGHRIDLYLLSESLFAEPPAAHDKVRHWGIENPSDSDIVEVERGRYCPYRFVQLQASRVEAVRILNAAGVNVQVFSPISQLPGSPSQSFKDLVMQFCIQTYILDAPHIGTNSIVVGSHLGSSLARNMSLLRKCRQNEARPSRDFAPVLAAFARADDRSTGSH